MPDASALSIDVASALSCGRRLNQEDAIISDFSIGDCIGFTVLADGMGGHQAGDVASKIVATEVFSELKLQSGFMEVDAKIVPETLLSAAQTANACLRDYMQLYPATKGMGATLIALVRLNSLLFWISVGDSVLFLLRDGKLRQLNEDHSLTPQLDLMVSQGLLSEEAARNHPDRSVLTSALQGAKIQQIDCPTDPLTLCTGDLVVAASDGLLFLEKTRIQQLLADNQDTDSAGLSRLLLGAIDELAHPDQDNICFSIMRIGAAPLEKFHFSAAPGRAKIGRHLGAVDESASASANARRLCEDGPGVFGKLRSLGFGLLR